MILTDQLWNATKAWRRCCRKHGGVKATIRRAWDHGDATALEIRDVIHALHIAQKAERQTKNRALLAAVTRCLETMKEAA